MTITEITAGLVDRPTLAAQLRTTCRTIGCYEREPDGLPYIRIGKRHYYRPAAVADWIARRERQHNPSRKRRRAA